MKPSYSGKHYIEFRTNLDNPIYGAVVDRFGAGTIAVLAGATQMAIQRQGDGSYRTYLGIPCPEDFTRTTVDLADVEGTRRLFLSAEFFGGWAEGFKELIRTGTNWRSWPLYHLPVDAVHWEPVTGLTLAGDAAHLALPNGDGVNVAMYDSLVLANKISEYGITDLSRAVREYEEDMFVRGQQSITDGIQLWEKMAHPDGAEGFCKYMKAKVGEEFETLVKN